MKLLIETNQRFLNIAILLLRIMTGLILFIAGAGKILGWFGGMGMDATLNAFKATTHIPPYWVYVSCYTEFIGGALSIVGLLTRPAALTLTINMLVAVLMSGFTNFFMGGAAYPCLVMICCLVILLSGPFAYSVDALLMNKKKVQFQTRNNFIFQ